MLQKIKRTYLGVAFATLLCYNININKKTKRTKYEGEQNDESNVYY